VRLPVAVTAEVAVTVDVAVMLEVAVTVDVAVTLEETVTVDVAVTLEEAVTVDVAVTLEVAVTVDVTTDVARAGGELVGVEVGDTCADVEAGAQSAASPSTNKTRTASAARIRSQDILPSQVKQSRWFVHGSPDSMFPFPKVCTDHWGAKRFVA
jgi:hypothetical protein